MSEEKKEDLTDTQKRIFECIDKNDVVLLKTLLTESQNVNIIDENSMSPLQHAAYKGNKEIVQMLLDQGADVNYCEHQHNYTALHLAGLSGNIEVCLALLMAGAKTQVKNDVNRTASQIAAFVGHHSCVAVMNNYVPKADVEMYTETGEKKGKLPAFLVESFHKFIMQVNIHPVRVILNLQSFVGLNEHLEDVKSVLNLMCEKEMKKETNEVMSFKFHYLSYIVNEIIKMRQRQQDEELFIRKLLKPGGEYMDGFLKECVREFPFRESQLFRQMVQSLLTPDHPSAINVLTTAINGHRGFLDNISMCNTCGEEKPAKKCSKCKVVQYCDRNCQRLHWHWHKKACSRLSLTGNQVENNEQPVVPNAAELSAELQNLLVKN